MGALLELATRASTEAGASNALLDSMSEARRQRVLAMLAERPGRRYAVVTDDADPAYADRVVLGIGIREDNGTIHTADLTVPRERYDGIDLLDLLKRHTVGSM